MVGLMADTHTLRYGSMKQLNEGLSKQLRSEIKWNKGHCVRFEFLVGPQLRKVILNMKSIKNQSSRELNKLPGMEEYIYKLWGKVFTYKKSDTRNSEQTGSGCKGMNPLSRTPPGCGISYKRRTTGRTRTATRPLTSTTPQRAAKRRRVKRRKTKKELEEEGLKMLREARERCTRGSRSHMNFWPNIVAEIVKQARNPDDSPQILRERARRAKEALEYNGESSSSEENNETDTDESDSELPGNEMGSAVSPGSGSSGSHPLQRGLLPKCSHDIL